MTIRTNLAIYIIVIMSGVVSCGTFFSPEPESNEVLDGPLEALTSAQQQTFLAGDEAFSHAFTPEEGLGPVFNQNACINCHSGDGRGHPSTNLVRFGRGDAMKPELYDYLIDQGGPQLQDHAIAGYEPEQLPAAATGISRRSGPIVVGLGLIEAIEEAEILSRADPDDLNQDGIRGVPNYVVPPDYVAPTADRKLIAGKMIGRFGRKAASVTLLQQTVGAYVNDMGITSDLIPRDLYNNQVGPFSGDQVGDPEVSSAIVNSVVFYLQTLRPPERRNLEDPAVQRGEKLFTQIGCASCHTPEMKTGHSPIAALNIQPVKLFSDLLLHDMGSELADNFAEGSANGRQWRTTPLWGLGLAGDLLGGTPYYLHDGRTSDLVEVIRLHGGEGKRSRDAYAKLPSADRDALLAFLRSL